MFLEVLILAVDVVVTVVIFVAGLSGPFVVGESGFLVVVVVVAGVMLVFFLFVVDIMVVNNGDSELLFCGNLVTELE